MITAVRRASDGLLADVQASPNFPANPAARQANAVAQFGGALGDWTVLEVPEGLWTGINTLARQFGTLAEGVISAISQSTPPAASLSAGTVENDGVAEITLTVTIPDYAGPVQVVIYPPNGNKISSTVTAAGGVATEAISTEFEGLHRVMAETEAHGVAWATFEGV
jgi:hypothetical protein